MEVCVFVADVSEEGLKGMGNIILGGEGMDPYIV
jgi:hypothetical protein